MAAAAATEMAANNRTIGARTVEGGPPFRSTFSNDHAAAIFAFRLNEAGLVIAASHIGAGPAYKQTLAAAQAAAVARATALAETGLKPGSREAAKGPPYLRN